MVGRDTRDINGALASAGASEWTVTNRTVDRTIDADAAVAVIGDGLATLIEDLIAIGILKGSVA